MKTITSTTLIAALGLIFVTNAYSDTTPPPCPGQGTNTYTPNYTTKAKFLKKWPSMVTQSVPNTSRVFCSKPLADGTESANMRLRWGDSGVLQHAASIQSISQVYWHPHGTATSGEDKGKEIGDYAGIVKLILHFDQGPPFYGSAATFAYQVENYIDANNNLCLASPEPVFNPIQPGTDTNDYGPSMTWYFIQDAITGLVTDSTSFFMNSTDLNPDGTAKQFIYIKNAYAPPLLGLPPTKEPNYMLEVNYVQTDTNNCNIQ